MIYGILPNSATRTRTAGLGLALIRETGNIGMSFSVYDSRYGVPGRPGADHAHEEGEGDNGEGEEEEGPEHQHQRLIRDRRAERWTALDQAGCSANS